MIKKDYMKPTMNVVQLKHHTHILAGSIRSVSTTGLDGDLGYDEDGDNQEYAW